ncbi:fatty acid-2 hydroxylase [Microstroma glucosiphilum]|uniref:Ceramide very long chain fatty acid hydroxylase n=1 Tax=Pseudomicrostroma glucosiphilum TaxID=1684307 RepID=A0A316UEA3_9BASI|nr:fatty acid-2 hydroxylase [Pseudomicrostroma glucosiphilum]PWN23522.1 fatty acid-2 hydroxylase [Pseudomicrostroma glucosiphilum]
MSAGNPAPSPAPAARRTRLISSAMMARHNKESSVWVARRGKVYDVTDFVPDHPGGDDLVMKYAGMDMGEIMDDVVEHAHSTSAYELLEEYYIGRLPMTQEEEAACADAEDGGADFTGKDKDIIITDDFVPQDSDVHADYKKHAFLDLSKPLIMQVWNAKFDKEFYLAQVHSPRHLKEPARLFGPDYLEMFTRTSWYVVPLIWVPIAASLFYRSAQQYTLLEHGQEELVPFQHMVKLSPVAMAYTTACFASGVFIWTLLEYTLHRFLFHVDEFLPNNGPCLTLHFLLHGIHHYLPMDRLRLVMPPLLFFVLSFPFTRLAYAIFPSAAMANGVIAGAFAMYVVYDMMHYALHHTKLPAYLRSMKQYHLEHHYKAYDLGFGVTSKFWDYVFGTALA